MTRLYGPGPEPPPGLIASGDLAGLSTVDVIERPVGELFGTLAEEGTGLIRYLDVSIRGAGRHVLVPIGHARIDQESTPPRVRLRAATYEDLMAVPELDEGTDLDAGFHQDLLQAHGKLFHGARYYAHPAYDHKGLHTGEALITGPDAPAPVDERLRPLYDLPDYRVRSSEKDIRGCRLVDEHGVDVGTVSDLLVDVQALKARYVVVQLDDPDRATVIPVGYVRIERPGSDGGVEDERACVRTPELTRDDIRLLPAYEPPLTREEENRIHAALEGRLTGPRYFQRPDFRPDWSP